MKLWDGSYGYRIEIWDPEKIQVQYGFAQYRYFSLEFAMIWQILTLFVYPEWLWSEKPLQSLGIAKNMVDGYGYDPYRRRFQPIRWRYGLTHQFDGRIRIRIRCGSLVQLCTPVTLCATARTAQSGWFSCKTTQDLHRGQHNTISLLHWTKKWTELFLRCNQVNFSRLAQCHCLWISFLSQVNWWWA